LLQIKALCVCEPTETKPAIICLCWRGLNYENSASHEKRAEVFRKGKMEVMRQIREMLDGICEVIFIGRQAQQPYHFCSYLNEDDHAS
jgi:hypothetical protein